MSAITLVSAPIASIFPSPHNPRKHFDQAKLTELADSIKAHGVLEPLVVRKGGQHYEIIAGERRYRAAKIAGLVELPIRVIDIDDDAMLELMVIENLQRDDLTPMEEARAYGDLVGRRADRVEAVKAIASKIGKSASYVWDRIKLNDLVPEAKKLMESGRITAGHGVVLARLKPEDQKRAIAVSDTDGMNTDYGHARDGGLWQFEKAEGLFTEEDEEKARKDPHHGLKVRTVAELQAWIARNVRFDPAQAATAAPLLYASTAQTVSEREAQPGKGKKVVSITHEYRVPDGARDESERTYGSEAWKRADGKEKSRECEHSVLGVIVAGPGYGEAFDVCVAKDKCKTHWGKEIAAKARAAKQIERGSPPRSKPGDAEDFNARWRREQAERDAQQKRAAATWNAAEAQVIECVTDAIAKAGIRDLAELLASQLSATRSAAKARARLKAGNTAEDLLRVLSLACLLEEVADNAKSDWGRSRLVETFAKTAGTFGAGVAAILKKHAAAIDAAAKAKAKPDVTATPAKKKAAAK